jgi:hypothetical protein
MPAGRPSKYEQIGPDLINQTVIECGAQGMSETEMAVELGVPRTTLRSWADQHPEFSSSLMRAKEASQAWWERQARAGGIGSNPGQINPPTWKHVVSCRFREDYRESLDVNANVRVEKVAVEFVE